MSLEITNNPNSPQFAPPEELIYAFLREPGDSIEMDVDGGTPVVFTYEAPAGKKAIIQRVIFNILDAAIQPTKFGGLAALGTGCLVEVHDTDDSVLLDFLDGTTIKQNSDFAILASIDAPIVGAGGSNQLPIRWTIGKSGKALKLLAGQKLAFTVQDNLVAMSSFRTVVQGYLLPL